MYIQGVREEIAASPRPTQSFASLVAPSNLKFIPFIMSFPMMLTAACANSSGRPNLAGYSVVASVFLRARWGIWTDMGVSKMEGQMEQVRMEYQARSLHGRVGTENLSQLCSGTEQSMRFDELSPGHW